MELITPITHRTFADVEFARLNPSRATENIGARDFRFFNRIFNNMLYLKSELENVGIETQPFVSQYIVKKVSNLDILRYSDIDDIRTDLEMLRSSFGFGSETPQVPQLPWLHFEKLNDIERILNNIDSALTNLVEGKRRFVWNFGMRGGEL